ncbi:Cell cycle control protein [Rutstroemia sp. NJR-2017a WRK4]|nr:Mediator complex subunit Med22 protein [Rutstroemia sp. NJR-2017a BBW]PQE21672.1 Cell cycle control protein [Rutstroemia sp. NJR-2017a WRK4]
METAQHTTSALIDREERAIAALLTRFKNLVSLAALPTEDAFAKEIAAAEGLRMEVESNALTSAAEDLLKLTRELKELWIFGPLRGIGEGEGEGAMEEDSKKVEELVAAQLKKKHEEEQQKA